MIKCPLCDREFPDMDSLEDHFKRDHYLTMRDFYEIRKDTEFDSYPLTYLTTEDGYYIPDWSKLKRRYEKVRSVETVKNELKDYYSNIVGDRFFQLFIIDNIYFSNTLPHSYSEFKEVLKILQKKDKKDRNKIWFLDWKPGYPRIICRENIEGLNTIQIDNQYEVKSETDRIYINDYEIRYPDIIPYNRAHHSRYNILNNSIDCRETKRLRLKSRGGVLNCIKFYNNKEDGSVKSLFKIFNKNTGEEVELEKIGYQDFVVIKLILLRNKSFIRLIFDMIEELVDGVSTLSDPIFLRNTIKTRPEDNGFLVNLSWLPSEKRERPFINISLL